MAAGNSLFMVIAFAFATLSQIPGSFVFAELTSAYPEDGGHYVYFREAGFKILTFIIGWLTFLALDGVAVSLMSLAIVNYLGSLLPGVNNLVLRIIAMCIVIGFALMHVRSVKVGATIQALITFIKIIPFVVIIGIGVFFIDPSLFLSTQALADASGSAIESNAFLALVSAISLSVFSCDGIFAGCYISGEIKNPKRTLPLGLILATLIVMVLYVALSSTASGLMTVDEIAYSTAPIADMAAKLPVIGSFAGPLIAGIAVLVIMGTISSCLLYMPRFEFAMARDGLFFPIFSKVHSKYKTPHRAITLFAVYVCVLVMFSDLGNLLGSLSIIILLKNALTYFSIFLLRRKKDYHPTYKSPGNWIMPVLAFGITGLLFFFAVFTASAFQLIFNGAILVVGVVAYFI